MICVSITLAKPAAQPAPQIYFPNSYVYPYYTNPYNYYPYSYYYYGNSVNSPTGSGGSNGYYNNGYNWLYPYTTTYWIGENAASIVIARKSP